MIIHLLHKHDVGFNSNGGIRDFAEPRYCVREGNYGYCVKHGYWTYARSAAVCRRDANQRNTRQRVRAVGIRIALLDAKGGVTEIAAFGNEAASSTSW
jgi:hypothetical protein